MRVTSKGQVTIPEVIRQHIHLQAGDQIECWRQHGVQVAMNNFNGACRPAEELKRR